MAGIWTSFDSSGTNLYEVLDTHSPSPLCAREGTKSPQQRVMGGGESSGDGRVERPQHLLGLKVGYVRSYKCIQLDYRLKSMQLAATMALLPQAPHQWILKPPLDLP